VLRPFGLPNPRAKHPGFVANAVVIVTTLDCSQKRGAGTHAAPRTSSLGDE
jgi:hypothetical protein